MDKKIIILVKYISKNRIINRLIGFFKNSLFGRKYTTPFSIEQSKGIISFTFDDAPQSAMETGVNLLNKYNKTATFYLSLSFLNSSSDINFDFNMLNNCIRSGHEIGCHTYSHIHLSFFNDNEIIDDLSRNQDSLNKIFPGKEFHNFAYPFGDQTKQTKILISKRFRSARGIESGINRNKIDLHNLRSIKLYEKTRSLSSIYNVIEEVKDSGGWLIFYTHDVSEDFSEYGCSPLYLESVLKKSIESNVDILNISQALNTLKIK